MKGGKQPGAGRPPTEDPARHTVKTRLTDEQFIKWQELGGSKWVKRMIEEQSKNILQKRLTDAGVM
jgi:hypothetical protein